MATQTAMAIQQKPSIVFIKFCTDNEPTISLMHAYETSVPPPPEPPSLPIKNWVLIPPTRAPIKMLTNSAQFDVLVSASGPSLQKFCFAEKNFGACNTNKQTTLSLNCNSWAIKTDFIPVLYRRKEQLFQFPHTTFAHF